MKKINLTTMWRKTVWGRTPYPSSQAQRGALCTVLALVFLLAAQAHAQDFTVPPNIEKLSAKAKETVEVTMDGPMLHWASKFLRSDDPDEARAAKIVANLKAIYVRSYEFDKEGAYSLADVEALRSEMNRPGWKKIVGVRSEKDENVDVFFKLEDDKMAGIIVIAAEPKELTFVHIDGPIEIDQLADLGGEFGVPHLHLKDIDKDKDNPPHSRKNKKLKNDAQKDAQKDNVQKDDAPKTDAPKTDAPKTETTKGDDEQ